MIFFLDLKQKNNQHCQKNPCFTNVKGFCTGSPVVKDKGYYAQGYWNGKWLKPYKVLIIKPWKALVKWWLTSLLPLSLFRNQDAATPLQPVCWGRGLQSRDAFSLQRHSLTSLTLPGSLFNIIVSIKSNTSFVLPAPQGGSSTDYCMYTTGVHFIPSHRNYVPLSCS